MGATSVATSASSRRPIKSRRVTLPPQDESSPFDRALMRTIFEEQVSFSPCYNRILKHLPSAILLAQLVRETQEQNLVTLDDGWVEEFHQLDQYWHRVTSLTPDMLAAAKRRLVELGLVIIERKGMPALLYYAVHANYLAELVEADAMAQAQVEIEANALHGVASGNHADLTSKAVKTASVGAIRNRR